MTQSDLVLPPIRTDLDQARADLEQQGLAFIGGAVSDQDLKAARRRLVDQAAAEVERGVAFHDGAGPTSGPNQRVWNLVNKGEIFRKLLMTPALHEVMGAMLGRDFLLSNFTANIARRGGEAQVLHGDQQFLPPETSFAAAGNCLFMLDDFTPENGATRVVPGSHLWGRWPSPGEAQASLPAVGPAGTLMIWDGRLWHGTGSSTVDAPRHGLLAYCSRPYLRQQETYTLSLTPEAYAACPTELREFMGFRMWAGNGLALGMIDGPTPGVVPELPVRPVAEFS